MSSFRQVDVTGNTGAYVLEVDGMPLKTPGKRNVSIPVRPLADAVAEEWSSVQQYSTKAMPLTSMVYSAIDVVPTNFEKMVDAMMAYVDTDLLLYRSESPTLKAKQHAGWNPILEWLQERYECTFEVTEGVIPVEQPYASLARLRRIVQGMDPYRMAAFSVLTQSLGSIMLALAVREQRITSGQAFRLSRIDEDYQSERWGEDSVSVARAAEIERDIHVAERFFRLAENG